MEVISVEKIKIQSQFNKLSELSYENVGGKLFAAKLDQFLKTYLEKHHKIPKSSGWRLVLTGSTSINTSINGSDVDVLALLPPLMSTKEFYGRFSKCPKG